VLTQTPLSAACNQLQRNADDRLYRCTPAEKYKDVVNSVGRCYISRDFMCAPLCTVGWLREVVVERWSLLGELAPSCTRLAADG